MQMDAVLRSFFLHCQDAESTQINVLYLATSNFHAGQYEFLASAYPQVHFVRQQDFRNDTLRILNPYHLESSEQKSIKYIGLLISFLIALEKIPIRMFRSILYRLRVKFLGRFIPAPPGNSAILFLVDDNLFVRDFFLRNSTSALQESPDAIGFSLRLGRNITYCYAMDQSQQMPQFDFLQEGVFKFNWTSSELDFAYPLEVSSSIYRSEDIFPLIAVQSFNSPNELEYQLAVSTGIFKNSKPFLLCPEKSYTFCNPLNLVQSFSSNRSSTKTEYSSEHLAALFEQGYRIDVKAYDGLTPESCHQEVPLEFIKPEKEQN